MGRWSQRAGGNGSRGPSASLLSGPCRHRPREQVAYLGLVQAQAEEHALARPFAPDDLLTLQGLQVSCGAGLGQPDLPRQIADAALTAHQLAHKLVTGRIAQAGHQAAHTDVRF